MVSPLSQVWSLFHCNGTELSLDGGWSQAVDEMAQGRGRNTRVTNTSELSKGRCGMKACHNVKAPPVMTLFTWTSPCQGDRFLLPHRGSGVK